MHNERLLFQLFIRESEAQNLVPQSNECLGGVDDIEYQRWLTTKRDLHRSDIADCHWIKTCTAGYITEVIFHSDGTLSEYRLFDRFETTGTWELESGILNVQIFKDENIYSFSVVGNSSINIHSAIEYKNQELHSYLKLSQIK